MEDIIPRILELALAIQQIPAPTFDEKARAEFVRKRFVIEGLANVEVDEAGNVYACLSSDNNSHDKPPLVISAHLDTVFPLSVNLGWEREPERLLAPGIGDNSLGVAGLFGLLWKLKEQKIHLPGDLWLVANTCEEGLGNLLGIGAVVNRFGPNIKAYLVLEGMALGQIYHRGLGVKRFRISVHTSGGHSWIDYGKPSAIHVLTGISTRLAALELPRSPRTTLNIGIISGGSSVNTIAADAMLELDLRSENKETLEQMTLLINEITAAAEEPGIVVKTNLIGQRPTGGISPDHPLVKLAVSCLQVEGIEPRLNIGSTDANLPLSQGLPAITIGLTTGGQAHTVHEYINISPLKRGMNQLVNLVTKAWDD